MSAQEVIVDPFLLCLPNPCNSLDQLEEFISAIVGWRGFLDRADTCVLLSDSARIALNTDGEFPHRHRLAELLEIFECTLADANTVSRVANSILERTPSLEDYYGINAVLIAEESFEFAPTAILDRLSTNCRVAFKDDLLIAGIKENECATDCLESRLIVASGGVTENPPPSSISIKADFHDIGLVSTDSDTQRVMPTSISQSIAVVFSHEQLTESLDLWTIWDRASSEEAVRLCIDKCVKNLISAGAVDNAISDFIIGNDFVASLHTWGADSRRDYAMVTVESCARIVLGIPKNPVKEFKESAEGTARQRTRDGGALAFRTHMTKKGVGLRLMFWKRSDGAIEFANIGGKDELEIL
ncbi:hypothetical protein [Vampirovibrio chlorellavorus]|uniref:hypothetical protein n=1 Tax=Vampirovibrio chlorellavorus TaxID=758823 RepID=UPI0026F030DF|nr:hypothetical protein [Vampirovibrio chlorellavorus]